MLAKRQILLMNMLHYCINEKKVTLQSDLEEVKQESVFFFK